MAALGLALAACAGEKGGNSGPPAFIADGDAERSDFDADSEGERTDDDGEATIEADPDPDAELDMEDALPCRSEEYCPEGLHCDPQYGRCLPACNPYYPDCPQGSACKPLPGGAAARPFAVCAPRWEGGDLGDACGSAAPCAAGFVCGRTERCEAICNPDGFADCPTGLSCTINRAYGIGACAFCATPDECGDGKTCLGGYCVQGGECETSFDCPLGEGCFSQRCEPGCTNDASCAPGVCDVDTHWCHGDLCEEDCGQRGLCCDGHVCGPCCSPACATEKRCTYDPRCYPELSCCVDPVDCRTKPPGY